MRAPDATTPGGRQLRANLRPVPSLRNLLVVPVVLQMVATAGKAVWTSIDNWVDALEVKAIGAGIPIRRDCRLVGVAEMDVFFQHQQLPGEPAAGCWGVGLPLNGTGELVRVEPFRDRYALDWRIVVTILGAVGVSGTLGMQAVRRVNASLTEVVEGSEALSEGNLDHEVTPGEAAETQRVAMSLNTMTPP